MSVVSFYLTQFITAKCENSQQRQKHIENWIIALRLPAIVKQNWPHGRNGEWAVMLGQYFIALACFVMLQISFFYYVRYKVDIALFSIATWNKLNQTQPWTNTYKGKFSCISFFCAVTIFLLFLHAPRERRWVFINFIKLFFKYLDCKWNFMSTHVSFVQVFVDCKSRALV